MVTAGYGSRAELDDVWFGHATSSTTATHADLPSLGDLLQPASTPLLAEPSTALPPHATHEVLMPGNLLQHHLMEQEQEQRNAAGRWL